MPLWRLSPIARIDDPHWLDREIWREIIVEAPTPAAARVAATDWVQPRPRSPEERNLGGNTGFEDEKLYRVDELSPEDVPPEAKAPGADGRDVLYARRL